eukprot:Sdes_comp20481_c0_seq1m14813
MLALGKKELAIFLFILINLVILVFSIIYRHQLLDLLSEIATYITDSGIKGYSILFAIIYISCFPPVPFYGWFLVLSGYIYKFTHGFLVAFPAAFLGGLSCFFVFRYCLGEFAQRKLMAYPKFSAIQQAITQEGFKFLLVLRLAPFPYTIVSAACALSSVGPYEYVIATGLSLLKIVTHLYVGATLRNIKEISLLNIWIIVGGAFFCLAAYFYAYRIVMKSLKTLNDKEPQNNSLANETGHLLNPKENSDHSSTHVE